MKTGIVLSTSEPEIAWNAFRTATYFQAQGEQVSVFLMNNGVNTEYIDHEKFRVVDYIREFLTRGGQLMACKTCLEHRDIDLPRFATIATLAHLHEMTRGSDNVLSF